MSTTYNPMSTEVTVDHVTWKYLNPNDLVITTNPALLTVGKDSFIVEIDFSRYEGFVRDFETRRRTDMGWFTVEDSDQRLSELQVMEVNAFKAYLCSLPAVPREAWDAMQDNRSVHARGLA